MNSASDTPGTVCRRGFDGDPLARFGDVVVVTVNHRLGLLGFLHLADLAAGIPAAQFTPVVDGAARRRSAAARQTLVLGDTTATQSDPLRRPR